MAYITEQELKDAFGAIAIEQLADRDGDADATKMSAAIEAAITAAGAEIDVYLAPVYPLPLASVPAVIKRIARDLARYNLSSVNPTDDAKARYNDATKLLDKLSKGDIELDLVKESKNAALDAPDRLFSRDKMQGF